MAAAKSTVNRTILPVVLLVTVFNYICRTNLEYVALQLNAQLNLSAAAYGTAAGLYYLGFGLLMVPSTFVSVRQQGRAWWYGGQSLLWGAVSMLHCLISSPSQLYALRVLLGAAQAGGTTTTWHIISQFYESSARGLPMMVFTLGQVVAMMVAPPLSAAILKYMSNGLGGLQGWQWLYLFQGAPSVLLGCVIMAWLPATPSALSALSKEQQEQLQLEVHGHQSEDSSEPPTWRQLPAILVAAMCNRALLCLSLLGLLWMLCMASLYSWLPLIVANILSGTALHKTGISQNTVTAASSSGKSTSSGAAVSSQNDIASAAELTTTALLLSTVPYVAAAAATVFVSWLASRPNKNSVDNRCQAVNKSFSKRTPHVSDQQQQIQRQRHTKMFHVAGPLLIGAVPLMCFAPAYTANTFAGFAMLCVALTAGFSAFSPMAAEASAAVPPSTAGISLTVFNLSVALGGLVGPATVGAVVEALGGFKWAVFMVGVVMATTGITAGTRGALELAAAKSGHAEEHTGVFDVESAVSGASASIPCRIPSVVEGVVAVMPTQRSASRM